MARRILVVEDAEDLATVLRDRFQRESYAVETVRDGESALQAAEQTRHDLILLDVMLPGINGFDVCRQLRQRNHAIPILMLTARSETVDKIVGLRLGADDYVTKPFDMGELVARVEALLRRASHPSGLPAAARHSAVSKSTYLARKFAVPAYGSISRQGNLCCSGISSRTGELCSRAMFC